PPISTTNGPVTPWPKIRVTPYTAAPLAAAAGSVKSHAVAMLPATPQRTADRRRAAPAPITPPLMTWVVEIGKPKCDTARITAAPPPCAANPWAAFMFLMRVPVVLMILQPPAYVPSPIAAAAEAITQRGTCR